MKNSLRFKSANEEISWHDFVVACLNGGMSYIGAISSADEIILAFRKRMREEYD